MSDEKQIAPQEAGKEFDRRAFFAQAGIGIAEYRRCRHRGVCVSVSFA